MQMLQYCAPLFAATPACSLLFMRLLPDQKVVLLSTHQPCLQAIYKNPAFFSSRMITAVLSKTSAVSYHAQLWQDPDWTWVKVMHQAGIQDSVNLWKRDEAGINCWSFGLAADVCHQDLTTKTIEDFKLFANHFSKRAATMIELMQSRAYIVDKKHHWSVAKNDPMQAFIDMTPLKYFPVIVDGKKLNITYKQALCLQGLCEGKKTKTLAKEMRVSYRTIEKHIENLKVLLNANKRNDMLTVYKQSRGYWL
jgi:DNA-binding CsgD family transcriptional regulator